jgi:hypothetical protein
LTEEIKDAARTMRRIADAQVVRAGETVVALTAADSFEVRGRGVVLWLDDAVTLPAVPSFNATIASPNRLPIVVKASVEIVDDRSKGKAARVLLLHGAGSEDVPPGAHVDICPA